MSVRSRSPFDLSWGPPPGIRPDVGGVEDRQRLLAGHRTPAFIGVCHDDAKRTLAETGLHQDGGAVTFGRRHLAFRHRKAPTVEDRVPRSGTVRVVGVVTSTDDDVLSPTLGNRYPEFSRPEEWRCEDTATDHWVGAWITPGLVYSVAAYAQPHLLER